VSFTCSAKAGERKEGANINRELIPYKGCIVGERPSLPCVSKRAEGGTRSLRVDGKTEDLRM
jgi:hypothetical protein